VSTNGSTPCDAEALVAFLYDECEPGERVRVARHLQSCAACAAELAALGGTRHQLMAWAPPEAALGFRMSAATASGAAAPARPAPTAAWWRQPLPAWAQAVAAVALFGLGLAAGSVRVAPAPSGQERTAAGVSAGELARVESRLREEIASLRPAAIAPARGPAPEDREAALMRQVRQLVRESEARQQETLALRATQLARDAEIQRRVDQANWQRTLAQMQGTTGEEVRQQRELLNYLVNVSQRGGR
jgi:hypothetical protein